MQDNADTDFSQIFRRGDEAAIRQALADGADLNAPGDDGELPIAWAAKRAGRGRAALLQRLDADANAADDTGWSAMALAAQAEEPDMLWELLRGGAKPDGDGTLQGTPLLLAAFGGLRDNLRLLIAAGADVSVADEDGQGTALILAIRGGNDECAKLLADAGCPLLAVDGSGLSALDHARAKRLADVLAWLEPIVLAHREREELEKSSNAGSAPSETPRV